jgi:hypothetical protein
MFLIQHILDHFSSDQLSGASALGPMPAWHHFCNHMDKGPDVSIEIVNGTQLPRSCRHIAILDI